MDGQSIRAAAWMLESFVVAQLKVTGAEDAIERRFAALTARVTGLALSALLSVTFEDLLKAWWRIPHDVQAHLQGGLLMAELRTRYEHITASVVASIREELNRITGHSILR